MLKNGILYQGEIQLHAFYLFAEQLRVWHNIWTEEKSSGCNNRRLLPDRSCDLRHRNSHCQFMADKHRGSWRKKKNIYTALLTSDLLLVQSLQKLEAKLPLDENYANKIKTEVRLSSRERGLSSTYVFLKHHSIMKNQDYCSLTIEINKIDAQRE